MHYKNALKIYFSMLKNNNNKEKIIFKLKILLNKNVGRFF